MEEKLIQPRFNRLRDAPQYLGFDRNRFNSEVRPYIVEIRVGVQGIALDRLDLDAFADHFRSAAGVPRDSQENGYGT